MQARCKHDASTMQVRCAKRLSGTNQKSFSLFEIRIIRRDDQTQIRCVLFHCSDTRCDVHDHILRCIACKHLLHGVKSTANGLRLLETRENERSAYAEIVRCPIAQNDFFLRQRCLCFWCLRLHSRFHLIFKAAALCWRTLRRSWRWLRWSVVHCGRVDASKFWIV
jgi:hypothetical protein